MCMLTSFLNHQHYPSFCLDKHGGKATDNGINLIGCNRLPVLANMQPLAVNHFRYLLSPHSSVLTCEAVQYGFFYLHVLVWQSAYLFAEFHHTNNKTNHSSQQDDGFCKHENWHRSKCKRYHSRREQDKADSRCQDNQTRLKFMLHTAYYVSNQANCSTYQRVQEQHTSRHCTASISLEVIVCRKKLRQGTPSYNNGQSIEGHNQNRDEPTSFIHIKRFII